MGDENGNGLFDPTAGGEDNGNVQPSTVQPSGENQETQVERTEPKVVTEDILNQRLEEFERKVQSSRDSALSSFDKRIRASLDEVERQIERSKKAGIPMKPEDEEKLRQQAFQEAAMNQPNSNNPSGPQPDNASPPDQAELVKRVNARAAQIQEEFGLDEITKDDPEFRLIERTSTPDAFLMSFRNACYQKALRTEAEAPPPSARISSMARPSGPPPKGAAQQFINEYKAAQGQGMDVARGIRRKYAKMNVDVDRIITENF